MNDKYLLDELEDKIFDTVNSYMMNVPKPYAAIVSGGFDSALLAVITKPYRAYRIKFPYGSKFDESRYADAVSKHLGLEINEIEVNPVNFRNNFEAAIKTLGEPTTHFSLVPLYILMKTMSEKGGEKNVISGEGPDEYLGGYARQIIVDELQKLYEMPELRNYHILIKKFLGFDNLALRYQEFMGYAGYPSGLEKYPLQGKIGKMDMKLGNIEQMEQKMAEHFGIKLHYPYINDDLAEFCYRLPDRMKIRNGVTKWGFKQVAMKYLPEVMRNRNKMGGPVCPVNQFMGWQDEMGDFGKEKYLEAQKEILGS